MPITPAMAALYALLIVSAAVVFRVLLLKRVSKQRPVSKGTGTDTRSYRAVSISCGESACSAAKALREIKYLAGQTLYLPLQDCDQDECTCRYAHYDDRRDPGAERRNVQAADDAEQAERRNSAGRRRTDWRSH
jgi:hypothetical protein